MSQQTTSLHCDPDWGRLVTITVTFNPEIDVLRAQLNALPQGCMKLVIDNASDANLQKTIRNITQSFSRTHFVVNTRNLGLAAAINQGVNLARKLLPEARYCLLLDQDSEPEPGALETLTIAFETLLSRGEHIACAGPRLVDAITGLQHGFHQATSWRWRRIYPATGIQTPIPCTNLNGSGTLTLIDLFLELGSLEEGLFIDHVDTEWAFRVRAKGYTLWGIPNAVFKHRMGQNSLRYWLFGWRIWPARSPLRHRFLFRNALWLMQRPYVPLIWKLWAVVKLLLTFTVHALFDPQRGAQVRAMTHGLREGFRGTPPMESKQT